MRHFLRRTGRLIAWAITSELGVFSITNKNFAVLDSSFLPANHYEIADLTMVSGTVTSATQDTGIAGNKWIRLRAIAKTLTGLSAGDTITITVQAGTGSAITGPTNVLQTSRTMKTGDTALLFQSEGWSNAGFQSFKVILDSSNTGGGNVTVTDVMIDIT